ncbi:unnamed protein product [Eruca vesicaria subsp. sativa]|uniref:HMG box domain-containing protein n=1 Tax=Eruca vesicaria subsp. sativa TaxID=29727 RepID=A0ABC8L086_ERUVS|nr:unnamed protein product [Eruca vesicaria subsp. sativa]
MAGDDGLLRKGLVTHAKDGTAFGFWICFREIYKCDNPYVNVKDVAKLGGEKWKSFTNEEKKVYRDKAAELMEKYNKSLLDGDDDDEEEDEEEETDDAEEKQADEVVNKKDALNGCQTGRGRGRRGRGRRRKFRVRGSRGWLGVFG